MRHLILCTAGLFALTSCANTVTPAQVTAVATDVTTLVADIQSAASGQPLTVAQAETVATDTAKLQADVTALNAGSTGTTVASVLGDISTAIADIGQFIPEIEALVAMAAPQNAGAVPTTKVQMDYAKLRADAATVK